MRAKRLAGVAVLAVGGLVGCSSPTPPVTPAPVTVTVTVAAESSESADTASHSPTETASTEADGSRANPLQPGDSRRLSDESMFTVSGGATKVHDTYAVLPLTVAFDWDSFAEQSKAAGGSVDDGVDPWFSIIVKFVTASGRSYSTMDDYDVQVPNEWYNVGTVYPPAEPITANVAVSVPASEVPGGAWAVSNTQGDTVFIASGS